MEQTPPTQPRVPSYGWVFLLALVLSLGVLGAGIYLAVREGNWAIAGAGAVSVIGSILAWPIGRLLSLRGRQMMAIAEQVEDQLRPVRLHAERAVATLNRISEQQLLSERLKGVAYREKERDALRRAIEEDILNRDFDGAMQLAQQMETSFGYKAEAEEFRQKIRRTIDQHRVREIDDATSKIDALCRDEDWPRAMAEAERMAQKYPDEIGTRLLPVKVEEKRQNFKRNLVEQYHDAVGRGDVDRALGLLKQLDFYLTPQEGQVLAESARGVFKGKLMQLKDQFARAMHEQDFAEALRVGDIITRDFPNSQLAKEVRAHEPKLRERAGLATA